jgi:hypothetical protein
MQLISGVKHSYGGAMKKGRNPKGRTGMPVSLSPLDLKQALSGLLQVKPDIKPKRKPKTTKKPTKSS